MVIKKCEVCGGEYKINQAQAHLRRTCSRKCHGIIKSKEQSGCNHPMWKGGIEKHNCGYLLIYDNGNGYRNKILIHRKIMEEHMGRKLTKQEIVHHKNGNKHDNRIENLELTTRSEHMHIHKDVLHKNRVYKANTGSFKKGNVPWIKGKRKRNGEWKDDEDFVQRV